MSSLNKLSTQAVVVIPYAAHAREYDVGIEDLRTGGAVKTCTSHSVLFFLDEVIF